MARDFDAKTVRMPKGLWSALASCAKDENRSVNFVINTAVTEYLVSRRYHSGTTVVSPRCYPDPARAPEQIKAITSISEESKEAPPESPAEAAARLLRELDWLGAKLPQRTDPEKYAKYLVETWPTVDVPHELRRAHNHQLGRKPPWRALAQALDNWMDNAANPPAWKRARDQPARPRQTTLGGNTFAPEAFAVGADDIGESDKPPHLMFAHAEEGERKE